MLNNFDPNKLSPEAIALLKSKGIDTAALKSKDSFELLSSLDKTEASKIKALLNDKQALEQMLSSDRAKSIINHFFGNGAK